MAIRLYRKLVVFLLIPVALAAWQKPVKVPTTGKIRENYVRLNSGNTAYIAYVENYIVKLAKYDGQKFTLIGQVSDGSRQAYLPSIRFSADNDVHIVWGEATTLADAYNSVMYRRFSESSGWSPINNLRTYYIPKPHRKGPLSSKIEDLHFNLDADNNLYIVFYESPSLCCNLLTRYGEEVEEETWPDPYHQRVQTPDIVVDQNDVHVTWNQFLYNSDGSYSIYYSKRPVGKDSKGQWSLPMDIRSGIEVNKNVHRPRIALDENRTPYVLYMQDTTSGSARVMYIRYLSGSAFDGLYDLTRNVTRTYNNLNLEMTGSANILVVAHGAYNTFYNWLLNDRWSGLTQIDSIPAWSDMECASLSADGSLAVVSYSPITSNGGVFFNELWLTANKAWKATQVPVAVIHAAADEVFWDNEVRLDGSASTDSDGTIVKYQWKIEQDHATLDGPVVSYRFNKGYGAVKVKLIVIDDQGARGSAEKVINVKALYTPVATWSKKKITTLVYNREGYVVEWQPNAKNDAAGYSIVKYKVFRKEADGDYMEIAEVGAEKKAYADIRIEAGKTYSYAVSAVDDQGHLSPYDNF
jgi:hypothetical protein